jgi:hypothetical protein
MGPHSTLGIAREKSVRNHLCEAPEGPVPGKWFLTLISPEPREISKFATDVSQAAVTNRE